MFVINDHLGSPILSTSQYAFWYVNFGTPVAPPPGVLTRTSGLRTIYQDMRQTYYEPFGAVREEWQVTNPLSWTNLSLAGESYLNLFYRQNGYAQNSPPSNLSKLGYTGQRNEASLGLYDYGARMYHPQLGRFVSADSVVPGPTDPQMLNRYSYVRNNPMGYTDPSGHFIAMPPMELAIDKKTGRVHIEAGKPTNVDRLIASLIVGDVNDLVTIVSGYDPIYGEAVPYGSSEWNRTVALAAVPMASGAVLKSAKKLDKAGKVAGVANKVENALDDAFAKMKDVLGGKRKLPFKDPDILKEVNKTLDDIERGGPFRYPENDDIPHHNREGFLPKNETYREYTVDTPGKSHRVLRRIVVGQKTKRTYYTHGHYKSGFIEIDPKRYID